MNVYNEIEPYAVEWIKKLEAAGKIPKGKVDDRSIKDIKPVDLAGVRQFHTFAGIAGWPLALRIARWPEDIEVWTGSCPCQPFSVAGNGEGEEDPRHLWPDWLRLIAARVAAGKPVPTIFGEQVASEAGKLWFADVRNDLEKLGYEVGGADLCAAGAGAKHIRQRLYFVAHSRVQEPGRRDRIVSAVEALARSPGNNGRGTTGACGRKPYEPRPFAVADGIPDRVALIKGYGNAIYPDIAAEFIRAYMEII